METMTANLILAVSLIYMRKRRPNAKRRQVISRLRSVVPFAALMRFEEERVACSMVREAVREGAGKEFKAAAFGLAMDYPVGRALRHARFGLRERASERARHRAWHVGGGNSPLVMSRRSLLGVFLFHY